MIKYKEPSIDARVLMTLQGPAYRIRKPDYLKPSWWCYFHCEDEQVWLIKPNHLLPGTVIRAMRREYVIQQRGNKDEYS